MQRDGSAANRSIESNAVALDQFGCQPIDCRPRRTRVGVDLQDIRPHEFHIRIGLCQNVATLVLEQRQADGILDHPIEQHFGRHDLPQLQVPNLDPRRQENVIDIELERVLLTGDFADGPQCIARSLGVGEGRTESIERTDQTGREAVLVAAGCLTDNCRVERNRIHRDFDGNGVAVIDHIDAVHLDIAIGQVGQLHEVVCLQHIDHGSVATDYAGWCGEATAIWDRIGLEADFAATVVGDIAHHDGRACGDHVVYVQQWRQIAVAIAATHIDVDLFDDLAIGIDDQLGVRFADEIDRGLPEDFPPCVEVTSLILAAKIDERTVAMRRTTVVDHALHGVNQQVTGSDHRSHQAGDRRRAVVIGDGQHIGIATEGVGDAFGSCRDVDVVVLRGQHDRTAAKNFRATCQQHMSAVADIHDRCRVIVGSKRRRVTARERPCIQARYECIQFHIRTAQPCVRPQLRLRQRLRSPDMHAKVRIIVGVSIDPQAAAIGCRSRRPIYRGDRLRQNLVTRVQRPIDQDTRTEVGQ